MADNHEDKRIVSFETEFDRELATNSNNKKQQVKPKTELMETRTNFRVRVMKYAHQLLKATGKSWRYCMLKAWELYRLAKKMRTETVRFAYEKTDGSIRYAEGTLMNLPAGATVRGKRITKPSYKTFAYFDARKNEMRCFRIENLITVY